jgi:ubiquinone/menaquinone biosynthesis C-methylase UbiE
MFFPDRIKSIKTTDKVLEIGPGATPYFRSDVFLELEYDSEKERIAQSGNVGILQTNKNIIYYDGGKFPFEDKEFDYVICSHVLEHVSDADIFLREIQRVGKKGYLEFPTVYYDYIYNFPEHQLFLFEKNGVVNWMTKHESGLMKYAEIQLFFNKTSRLGYFDLIDDFKEYFFQGFEWFNTIESKRVTEMKFLLYPENNLNFQAKKFGNFNQPLNKIYSMISFKSFLIYKIKKKLNFF